MKWSHFFGLILASYFAINLIFASIYTIIGVEHLKNTKGLTSTEKFLEAFFFSVQTITTLGYRKVAPIGLTANSITAIESMLGLLSFHWKQVCYMVVFLSQYLKLNLVKRLN